MQNTHDSRSFPSAYAQNGSSPASRISWNIPTVDRSNTMNQVNMQSKWIIHVQHCNLKKLMKVEPKETKHSDSIESIGQYDIPKDYYKLLKIVSKIQGRLSLNFLENLAIIQEIIYSRFIGCANSAWPIRLSEDSPSTSRSML